MQKQIFTRSARIGAVIGLSAFASLSGLMGSQADANTVVATVPAVGAVLSQAPNAISVTAASSLLPDGDSLSVTDPSGAQVDDGSLTISDTSAVVGLKPLTVTGIYTVSYTLLSATDAPLTGSYTFLFNAPATVTSPSAAPTPSVSPAKGASNSSANVAVLVFLGLATVVALFLLWYARMIWKQYRKGRKRAARERSPK
jgi:methionine-rich copper-binding protein CopC